jgi:RNA polymerase sigma-70 factor, ECF subfamily
MLSEDARLVALARTGDDLSFEQLYRKYREPVFRTAMRMTRDAALAEEVQQDCFMRAYDCLDRLNPAPSIGPWLRRVTVNLCLNHLRRRKRVTVPLENLSFTTFDEWSDSSEDVHARKEVVEVISSGLDNLSVTHRRVLILHYLQGFDLGEISVMLDCPVGTVKSRLYYARRRLCEALRETGAKASAA